MSKYSFKIDIKGVRQNILQADWMKTYISELANSQAGADSHVKSFMGYDRAKAIIYPNTKGNPK